MTFTQESEKKQSHDVFGFWSAKMISLATYE